MAIGTALAIGGGIASLASGVANYAANKSAGDRAAMLQNEALQNWLKVNVPDPKQQELALQQFVQTGQLTPQLEKAIQASPSEFQNITSNEDYEAAQNRALKELSRI